MVDPKSEGFWTETNRPNKNGRHWKAKKDFLRVLSYVEQTHAAKKTYRGFSRCRVCGNRNGSEEFSLEGWTWPSGYSHYVKQHDHKPTKLFLAFIKGFASKAPCPTSGPVWRMEVESSNISLAVYNPRKQALLIEFVSGDRYIYDEVTVEEFTAFSLAESKGKWLTQNVKGVKTFVKLDK